MQGVRELNRRRVSTYAGQFVYIQAHLARAYSSAHFALLATSAVKNRAVKCSARLSRCLPWEPSFAAVPVPCVHFQGVVRARTLAPCSKFSTFQAPSEGGALARGFLSRAVRDVAMRQVLDLRTVGPRLN